MSKTGTIEAISGTSTIHAGAKSAALESRLASNSPRAQGIEDYSSNPFNAAIGIRNGLIAGFAFWVFAYLLYSAVTFFA